MRMCIQPCVGCVSVVVHLSVCLYLCVSESLLHAGPSAQGDNKHISPQTEAKQPL